MEKMSVPFDTDIFLFNYFIYDDRIQGIYPHNIADLSVYIHEPKN